MTDSERRARSGLAGAAEPVQERPAWDNYAKRYQTDWEEQYGEDRPWSDHGDAYRYGWEAAQSDRHRGRDFTGAESDLERAWPVRYDLAGEGYLGGHTDTPTDLNEPDHEARKAEIDEEGAAGTITRGEEPAEHRPSSAISRGWEDFKDTVREGFERARLELGGHRDRG